VYLGREVGYILSRFSSTENGDRSTNVYNYHDSTARILRFDGEPTTAAGLPVESDPLEREKYVAVVASARPFGR
jgi:hypothetical protein